MLPPSSVPTGANSFASSRSTFPPATAMERASDSRSGPASLTRPACTRDRSVFAWMPSAIVATLLANEGGPFPTGGVHAHFLNVERDRVKQYPHALIQPIAEPDPDAVAPARAGDVTGVLDRGQAGGAGHVRPDGHHIRPYLQRLASFIMAVDPLLDLDAAVEAAGGQGHGNTRRNGQIRFCTAGFSARGLSVPASRFANRSPISSRIAAFNAAGTTLGAVVNRIGYSPAALVTVPGKMGSGSVRSPSGVHS